MHEDKQHPKYFAITYNPTTGLWEDSGLPPDVLEVFASEIEAPRDEQDELVPHHATPPTRVYHVNRDPFEVYVGRRVWNRPDLAPIGWGNPYRGKDLFGQNAVQAYREWIAKQPQLLARLHELRGRRLGCWCAPTGGLDGDLNGRICHGQILAALADALPD